MINFNRSFILLAIWNAIDQVLLQCISMVSAFINKLIVSKLPDSVPSVGGHTIFEEQ